MSVLRKEYDWEKHTDETWYESSNLFYTKFIEYSDENFGDLYVVFLSGKQYVYRKVAYEDYLSLKLAENSSGKALNEHIIKKYPAEKLNDANMEELMDRLKEPVAKDTDYYVHGSCGYDNDLMTHFYIPTIQYLLDISSENRFVTTLYDEYGIESFKYMVGLGTDPERFVIYMKKSDCLPEELSDCISVCIPDEEYKDDVVDGFILKNSTDDVALVSESEMSRIKEVSKSAYRIIERRLYNVFRTTGYL